MKNTLLPILAVGLASLAAAQYGPAPPRINIPGAIPLPVVRGVPIREERVLPPQTQILRVRRPGGPSSIRPPPQHQQQIPIQFSTPKFFESEAKPVTEEHEEPQNSAPFLPIIHSSPAPPPSQHSPIPQQHSIPDELDDREIQQNILSRFNSQDNRPAPIPRAQIPERFFSTEKELSSNAQRFNIPSNVPAPVERPAPVPSPKQYRPAPQQVVQQRPRVQQQQQQHYDEDRPHSRQQQEDERRKKPVAQILRKWREEHEDGSITWGFENDDGSFKEETIGIDCVTRGSYGYVDPDGEKREYTYETGILCDPNKRDEEDEEELEDELQLKNKLKRPNQPQQQQQQGQQQYYRN